MYIYIHTYCRYIYIYIHCIYIYVMYISVESYIYMYTHHILIICLYYANLPRLPFAANPSNSRNKSKASRWDMTTAMECLRLRQVGTEGTQLGTQCWWTPAEQDILVHQMLDIAYFKQTQGTPGCRHGHGSRITFQWYLRHPELGVNFLGDPCPIIST